MNKQRIIVTHDLNTALHEALALCEYDKLFVLTDNETYRLCLPLIQNHAALKEAEIVSVASGDVNKNLNTASSVWKFLCEQNATRKSLLLNLGGGMITDLGGFVASTFKRGIAYINIPTTLLGAVDAAVGGKTGINFNGFKNEIGVFNPAGTVLINTAFFKTLDRKNILSGYAEMLKHGLISSVANWNELLKFDLDTIDYGKLQDLLVTSVKIKEQIVSDDPYEKNIRKALNLGHTVGHAFESFSFDTNRPLLHGYAVAFGLICELFLSHAITGFPAGKLRQAVHFIGREYGDFPITCNDYEQLYDLMTHDKKNESGAINFTLLEDIGHVKINQTADKKLIFDMLDFYQDM